MGGTPAAQIDYDALAAKHAAPTVDYDALATKHGGTIDNSTAMAGTSEEDAIKTKYGLPKSVDLKKTIIQNWGNLSKDEYNNLDWDKFSQAYQEANPKEATPTSFLGRSWDEVKNLVKGAFGESALFGDPSKAGAVAGSQPPNPVGTIENIKSRGQEAVEHPAAAAGAAAVDAAALAAPFLDRDAIFSKISPARTIEHAMGRTLTAAEADAPRPGGQIQPALNNTPREVLQHASQEGIKLTPGQATEDAMAQNLQKAGMTAAIGGKDLAAAVAENRTKFGQAVNNFMDDVDPKRAGLSSESAGETIKRTAQVAKEVAHDNASQGYDKIDYLMDRPIDGSPISNAWNKVKGDLPMGAEENILAQTPRSMRAVVEDLLSGKPEGFKPTFAQGIQLRKFFRDLGETEGLPDRTQATYQKMQGAADSMLEAGAKTQNAVPDWRVANAGWKDYATKYGDPQSVLYKVLRQQDPVRTVNMLTNAPATDILTLKNEGMDAALEPLRRQVVQDIARSRFNIAHDGLGGYSDSYLKALFDPAQVKELYLKADLANRLKYDPNPSGTAAGLQSIEQLKLGNQTKMSLAAKLSMPRDPLSFLPSKPTAVRTTPFQMQPPAAVTSPITGAALAQPAELFKRATNQ